MFGKVKKQSTLLVPIVDENGEYVIHNLFSMGLHHKVKQTKELSFEEVCKALQEMCGIEITYQEIKGKEGVVIYEKDSE